MTSLAYKEQYEIERTRLLEALGKVTEGGIVEEIQHIGATSIPGLLGSSCVDIGLTTLPFPLEEGPRARLEAMGYRILEGFTGRPQQRFRHEAGQYQLFVVEPGTDDWSDLVLLSDYLRHNDEVCAEVSAKKSRRLRGQVYSLHRAVAGGAPVVDQVLWFFSCGSDRKGNERGSV